eukprot:TRINITY_DN20338_c0_g1_i1.p1 TRINITY_DN20338_c0_g1~~TRINITY_DN20338_c0_g1_i1.p1  ORF type:complete len:114 (+),score=42.24 TRINITY_DN20338_c0_g1_i1:65-406(+)
MCIRDRTYTDLNHIIASSMIGLTCSLRFPGQLNCDLRKMATNLIPFPRMHFLTNSIAPLTSRFSKVYRKFNVKDLINQVLSKNNSTCSAEYSCLLYTSPSPRDLSTSRMPSSA